MFLGGLLTDVLRVFVPSIRRGRAVYCDPEFVRSPLRASVRVVAAQAPARRAERSIPGGAPAVSFAVANQHPSDAAATAVHGDREVVDPPRCRSKPAIAVPTSAGLAPSEVAAQRVAARRRVRPQPRGSAEASVRLGRGGDHAGACAAGSKHPRRGPTRRGKHERHEAPSGAGCRPRWGGPASVAQRRTCVLTYVVRRTDAGVCKTTCKTGAQVFGRRGLGCARRRGGARGLERWGLGLPRLGPRRREPLCGTRPRRLVVRSANRAFPA